MFYVYAMQRAVLLTAHWHDTLAPDSSSAFQYFAEPDHMKSRITEDFSKQKILLFDSVN